MEIICIVCPNGCRMEASGEGGNLQVSGNLCPKGIDFAKAEITAPMRSLTTTVATVFPESPRLPVKTRSEIPKGKVMEAMAKIRTVVVHEPKKVGDVILPDVFGTDIIATGELAR
ncbi:MAG: DUF1667 domain-containing protein [Oscillospiraceae bacterium]|jgi:CxxC motif-containing protein|nr:DUF1667 domain-containing protein [Oscillospiraceae bacterium]